MIHVFCFNHQGFKVYSRDPSPEEKKSEPETGEGLPTNLSVPESCRSNRSHSLGGGPTPPSSAASTGSSTGCLFPENDQIQIHIQGSNNNLTTNHDSDTSAGSVGGSTLHIPSPYHLQRKSIATSSAIYQEKEKASLKKISLCTKMDFAVLTFIFVLLDTSQSFKKIKCEGFHPSSSKCCSRPPFSYPIRRGQTSFT